MKNQVYKFTKAQLPSFLINFLLYVITLIIVCIAALNIREDSKDGHKSTPSAWNFSWNFHPKALPYDSAFQNYTVLMDFHSHSKGDHDPYAYLDPEATIQWHLAAGFNAFVVSDHDTIEPALAVRALARSKYNDRVKVIVAEEWSSCRVHLNLININETIPMNRHPTDDEIKAVIDRTHELGGLVMVNHYADATTTDSPTLQQFFEWGVDLLEVVNGFKSNLRMDVLSFAKRNSLGVVTGTDMHWPDSVSAWTVLKPSEFSEEAILEEIKQRRTSFIVGDEITPYTTGDWIPANYGTSTKPWLFFASFLKMFRQEKGFCQPEVIYSSEIRAAIGWLILIFLFVEVSRISIINGGPILIKKALKCKLRNTALQKDSEMQSITKQ